MPRTDELLAAPGIVSAIEHIGARRVREQIRLTQARVRRGHIAAGDAASDVVAHLPARAASLTPVINATGVVLHTNLGRAPLSAAAIEAMASAAGYVDVELDLTSGRRSRRGAPAISALIAAVPGAEAGLIVNNGAAALLLATTVLGQGGGEIIVSRGEIVEIGDGFRLLDLMTSTGTTFREVGSTNRTRLADYADAMTPATRAIVKVHPSNFRMSGFTEQASVAELAGLGLPLVHDIGSGLLRPHPLLPDEPDATASIAAGAAVVTCSGDKLLGGPQAGLIVGRADVVERMSRHPLARALRVDKTTLAALEATLDGPITPTWSALSAPRDALRSRCEALRADLLGSAMAALPTEDVTLVPSDGLVGGGCAPGMPLPGWAVALPSRFARLLRGGSPAVLARVDRDRCLIDLRCVPATLDAALAEAIRRAAERSAGGA